MTGLPAVFLDRDGIINRAIVHEGKPYPPIRLEDVEVLSGAITSLQRLAGCGYVLIGITNQPDVARGTQSREAVEAINRLIQSQLPIREIFVCYHDNVDDCDCRKPKDGLFVKAQADVSIVFEKSWMIGDSESDMIPAYKHNIYTVFISQKESQFANKKVSVISDLQGGF